MKRSDKRLAGLSTVRMYHEVFEQPGIFAKIWAGRESMAHLANKLSKASWVVFTAFGSSYNAALYGQLLFYRYLGIPSFAATPGFFISSRRKLKISNGLVIAISQSGEVQEVIEAVKHLKKTGLRTLAITNTQASPLARQCDEVLLLRAGPEKSVPATKTFTATLFTLQLLAAYWNAPGLLKKLGRTEELSRNVLKEEEKMFSLAEKLVMKSRGFVLSSEALKPVAAEGSLKLNECSYFMAEPFEWREFFHGPIALAEEETPALLLEEPGTEKTVADLSHLLRRRGVHSHIIRLPLAARVKTAELGVIPFSVSFQLLALGLGLLKGRNPDRPRSLHKVTQTPLG